jgi:hypothetical protein
MAPILSQATAGPILKLLANHKRKMKSVYIRNLRVDLEMALSWVCEIEETALRRRVKHLYKKYRELAPIDRPEMASVIQTDLRKRNCSCYPGRGYVLGQQSPPRHSRCGNAKPPLTLREADPDLRATLMQARFRKSSGGQYFSATRILTVVDVVTVPAESGQTQPEGVNLSCDSCISRENKTANGATTHELDILCFEAWRGDPEKVAIVTAALAELYKHGKLATTFTTRTAGNKQVMRCCGLRWSGQGTDGEHVGLHVFRKVVAIAEEACAALVMPKAVEAIERPVLDGFFYH